MQLLVFDFGACRHCGLASFSAAVFNALAITPWRRDASTGQVTRTQRTGTQGDGKGIRTARGPGEVEGGQQSDMLVNRRERRAALECGVGRHPGAASACDAVDVTLPPAA
eukprot:203330-Rhodomonas_salina.1